MTAPFRVEALNKAKHSRENFHCRSDELDRYFKQQVGQDVQRRIAACFVAVESDTGRVVGFYTLGPAEILLPELPESVSKKLARYPALGAARLGRLAVDASVEGQGLGRALIADALDRVLAQQDIPAFATIVDAKDDRAVLLYTRNGFRPFATKPMTLFIVMSEVAKLRQRQD